MEEGAAESGQFSMLEREEKQSGRQAGQRGQIIVALLKVKNGGGEGVRMNK